MDSPRGIGYFYNSLNMGSRTGLFGQLWKKYALSARYMTQGSFVVCMESVTACFWDPLSFLCAYYIIVDSSIRQPVQLIICLGQLYAVIGGTWRNSQSPRKGILLRLRYHMQPFLPFYARAVDLAERTRHRRRS